MKKSLSRYCCDLYLIVGSAGKTLAVLGVSGYRAVAMGALAYNVFPMILAPFFNIESEPLELQ